MKRTMRLSEMIAKLEAYLPTLQIKAQGDKDNPSMVHVTGLDDMRYSCEVLYSLNSLKTEIDKIKNHIVYKYRDNVILEKHLFSEFSKLLEALYNKGSTLLNTLLQTIPESGAQEIYIKLPKIKNLKQLETFVGVLNQAFDDHSMRLFGETLELRGFDTGSDWIILTTIIPDLYLYICGFLNCCQIWQADRHKQKAATQLFVHALNSDRENNALRTEREKTLNSMIETVETVSKEAARTLIVDLIESRAKGVSSENRNEAINSAMTGMEKLLGLVNQGAEISRSLNTTPAAQALLLEPLKILNSEVKLLPANAEKKSDSKSSESDDSSKEGELH